MTFSARRAALVGAVIVIVMILFVPVGRWQAHRALVADRHQIEQIAALAGPLDGPRLSAYRVATYDCLLYTVGKDPFAIELCFDSYGHLVEAIDRRHYGFAAQIGSVQYAPSAAPVTVPPPRLLKLIQRSGGLLGVRLSGGLLPGPYPDAPPVITKAAALKAQRGD
jgi:hypothetical protein